MKTREEQLAEMAKLLCSSFNSEYCHHDCPEFCDCRVLVHCEGLQYAGYRKQSDAVREFVEKVLKIGSKRPLCLFNEYGEGYIDCIENIKKIAKEYGVEVEE